MGTVNVFLGPSATSQSSGDYTLSGWDKDGAALTLTSWSWTETGNGGYVVSHANLIPGCSYWLRKTSGGTPWAHGEIGANVIADIQSGLATAAQVAAIGSGTGAALNFEAVEDNASGAIIGGTTKVGTQTLTFSSTTADNAVYHDIAHAGNAIDWVYGFSVGGGRNASKVTFNGQYIVAAPVAGKSINVYAWNFTGTPAWQLMKAIPGQIAGADVTVDIALLSAHTGTGTDAGKVYIRFQAATNAVQLRVDQLLLQAQNLGQTIGYANGSIWIEADAGGNTSTTPYVDGTGDNPCTYAAAKTLSTALGIKRFIVTPGTTITLDAALTGAVMTGRSYGLLLGGNNISQSYFEGVESLSGIGTTATGEAIFVDCHVGALGLTLGEFDMVRCHVHGTITLSAASKYYRMHDCTGIENATIEFGAATQTLALTKMSGAFTITGMTTGDTLLVDGDGVLTLGATCDGGTVHIAGNIELTNSGSGQTITYGTTSISALSSGDVDQIRFRLNLDGTQTAPAEYGTQRIVLESSPLAVSNVAARLLAEYINIAFIDGTQTDPLTITPSTPLVEGEWLEVASYSSSAGTWTQLYYLDHAGATKNASWTTVIPASDKLLIGACGGYGAPATEFTARTLVITINDGGVNDGEALPTLIVPPWVAPAGFSGDNPPCYMFRTDGVPVNIESVGATIKAGDVSSGASSATARQSTVYTT